ncbi:MAG: MBL fold metallo-hydrolase [Christensenellales bacterium]|jgi:phosphoribosyl 1,2-cyclic phosphate phosphodiesterase
MRIRFLGTAAYEAIPALFCTCDICQNARKVKGKEIRTRCGALVDGKIKLDFPPDTYLHILRDNLDFSALETLLITHSHSDHFAFHDIQARLAPYAVLPDGAKPLTVYGSRDVERMYRDRLERRDESRIRFRAIEPFKPFETAEGYTATALKAEHMQGHECALFYLLEKDGRKLLYAHDTAIFPAESFEYLKGRGIDLVSLDCTSGKADGGSGHMGVREALEMRERLLASGAAKNDAIFVLNHFSHNGGYTYQALSEEMDGTCLVSYDGMEIEF